MCGGKTCPEWPTLILSWKVNWYCISPAALVHCVINYCVNFIALTIMEMEKMKKENETEMQKLTTKTE